jgi:phospholipase/carboxylesterase
VIDALQDRLEEHANAIKVAIAIFVTVGFTWWWLSDPPVEVGPSPAPNRRVLILLHGHGASKTDLEPIAEQLTLLAPNVSFILPSAPHRTGPGRTWYPSFSADSQEAVDARLLELRAEARAVVADIVDDLKSDGVPPQQIYVGGFSQGATVALDVLLTGPADSHVGGLVWLSGGALALDLAPLATRRGLRAFVSHGTSDSVLGSVKSENLVSALEDNDLEVEFVQFDGGHAIPPVVVQSLGAFLSAP